MGSPTDNNPAAVFITWHEVMLKFGVLSLSRSVKSTHSVKTWLILCHDPPASISCITCHVTSRHVSGLLSNALPTYAAYESKHVHVSCSAKQILFPRIRHKQILGINAGIVLSNKNPPVNIT